MPRPPSPARPPRALSRALLGLALVAPAQAAVPPGDAVGTKVELAAPKDHLAAPPGAEAAPPTALPDLRREAGDPPARAGRIARLAGGTTTRLPGAQEFEPAQRNLALTTGSAVATGPDGRLAVEIGPSRLGLDPGTRLDLTTLDDGVVAMALGQGRVALTLAEEPAPPRVEIATDHAVATLAIPGRYVIEAGEGQPMRLAVHVGAATLAGPGGAIEVPAGQSVLLGDAAMQPVFARLGAPPPLLVWIDPPAEPVLPLPPAVRAMTGAGDLARYGRWARSPQYGDVWYPDVAPGWAPFREGQWREIGPWGETWVDAAPWGFAPSHYGRWVVIDGIWAWAPQPVFQAPPLPLPVFLPAVVGFGVRGDRLPLAPFVPYRPPFAASPRYAERANWALGHGGEAWRGRVPPVAGPLALPVPGPRLAPTPGAGGLPPVFTGRVPPAAPLPGRSFAAVPDRARPPGDPAGLRPDWRKPEAFGGAPRWGGGGAGVASRPAGGGLWQPPAPTWPGGKPGWGGGAPPGGRAPPAFAAPSFRAPPPMAAIPPAFRAPPAMAAPPPAYRPPPMAAAPPVFRPPPMASAPPMFDAPPPPAFRAPAPMSAAAPSFRPPPPSAPPQGGGGRGWGGRR